MRVKRPIELKAVRLTDGALEPDAWRGRIVPVRRYGQRVRNPSYPGLVCSTTWPPAGFGTTQDDSGRFEPGDTFMVVFYVQVPWKPGAYDGVLIEYVDDGAVRQQEFHGLRLRIKTKPGGLPSCLGASDSFFK